MIINPKAVIMARRKRQKTVVTGKTVALALLALAAVLTLAQLIFEKCFGVDLGITFFGQDMF